MNIAFWIVTINISAVTIISLDLKRALVAVMPSILFELRNIVSRFINGGSFGNLCALDFSKAFDKVNHSALCIKLMKRRLPVEVLNTYYWLDICSSCIRWNGVLSQFFKLTFGVRQGSVLSPFLFAIYFDGTFDYSFNDMSSFIIVYTVGSVSW